MGLRSLSIDRYKIVSIDTEKRARWILELDPLNWVILHTNADALSRRPQDPEAGMGNNALPEATPQVNAKDTGGESTAPQTDTLWAQPTAADPQASDGLSLGQQIERDSSSDDLSFVHALSHDGIGMRELQQADPDIGRVLEWIERSGSR